MTSGKSWKKLRENNGMGVIEIILTVAVIVFAVFMAMN